MKTSRRLQESITGCDSRTLSAERPLAANLRGATQRSLAAWFRGVAVAIALLPAARAEELLKVTGDPGEPGGTLLVALRAEPKTFNPVMAIDHPSLTVIHRLMADLVHIDRQSHLTTAALAKSWAISPDGRRFTLELRRGIRFSDGYPLSADDVLFTFEVYLDERVAAPHRSLLIVGGEPIAVRKVDSHTLVFELEEPYAVGERLFDSLPILPRHRLAEAFRDGRLDQVWGLSTPPEEIAGLGPFKLEKYLPGERLELVRNPYYWKVDQAGRRLPYLDRLTFLFVTNEDTQTIRFQAGESHLTDRLDARNYTLLKRDKKARGYELADLGAGLEYTYLFFNRNALAGRGLSHLEPKQRWFNQLAFRRAVSTAINRDSIVRLVYSGRATPIASPVTPGNRRWIHPAVSPPEHSPEAARELLRTAGFRWDSEGTLLDSTGREVELSILTSSSNRQRSEIAALIQDDLSQIGMRVHVVALEFQAMVDRIVNSYDYEACILASGGGDVDPNSAIHMLTSSGAQSFWRLARPQALSPWQSEIDHLMEQQLVTLDPDKRRRLYFEVQRLVADNVPMVFLISPNVLAGAASRLGNFKPSILDHFTLWNADELFWREDRPAQR